MLPVVPMFHANAWGQPYAAVMAGADLLLPDRFLQAEPLVDMIEQQRPTVAAAVPTIWNDVLQYLHANPGQGHLVSEDGLLRRVGRAAGDDEGVPGALRRGHPPGLGDDRDLAAGRARHTAAGGDRRRPVDDCARQRAGWLCGVEIRIVDDEGSVLPNDGKAVGEIEIRGPWITASYYQNADPSKFDDGWLRTGDVGRVDPQGFITLTDRAKDVIKSGGEWISSVELETVHHGAPGSAGGGCGRRARRAVAGAAIGRRRDQEGRLGHAPRSCESICATRVARFWLPERWTFIDEVPKTSVGKFDKKHIRALYSDGAYDVVECRD